MFKLEQAGYRVRTAGDGEEGLAAAQEERPDLVLLDVMMPRLSGIDVCRALRGGDTTRDIPVILLTAKVHAKDRAQLEELGVKAVLAKPFDPVGLPGQVAAALGWS